MFSVLVFVIVIVLFLSHTDVFVSHRIHRNHRTSFHLVVSSRWRWNPRKGTRFTVPAMRGVTLTAHPLTAHRLVVLIAPATVPLRQGDERSGGGGWLSSSLSFLSSFYLTQNSQNTQNYLSSSRWFTLALESADFVAGFATTAMRGVTLTAHPLSAHRLSFILSHFCFLISPFPPRQPS